MPQAAPVAPAPKAKKAGKNMLPIIIGAAAAVVVLVVVLVLLLSGGPKSVVKDYLNLSEDIAQAEYDRDKEITKLEAERTELKAKYNKKARSVLKLDKDKETEEEDYTWEITDMETFGSDDKPFKGLIYELENNWKANVKKVSKLAIVEVKFYDKNDKKNEDKIDYQYFSLAKISGKWYILEITKEVSAKENPKLQNIANSWKDRYKEESSK